MPGGYLALKDILDKHITVADGVVQQRWKWKENNKKRQLGVWFSNQTVTLGARIWDHFLECPLGQLPDDLVCVSAVMD